MSMPHKECMDCANLGRKETRAGANEYFCHFHKKFFRQRLLALIKPEECKAKKPPKWKRKGR